MGFYPPGEFNNAETFAAGLSAILADYPAAIVQRVVDPRRGIPGKQKFAPRLAEVRDACETEMRPFRREAERQRSREQLLALPPPVEREGRPTIAELKARCGQTWGISAFGPGQPGMKSQAQEEKEAKERLVELREEARSGLSFDVSPELASRLAPHVEGNRIVAEAKRERDERKGRAAA